MKVVSGVVKWCWGYLGLELIVCGNVVGDVFGVFYVVVCGVLLKLNVVLIYWFYYSSCFMFVSVVVMSCGMFKEIGGFVD